MTQGERNMMAAIQALEAAGFREAGQTEVIRVRVATVDCPVYGGIGGKAVNFGGRMRYAKDGTNIKATVGKRTTNIYRVENGNTDFIGMFDTKDLTKIQECVSNL